MQSPESRHQPPTGTNETRISRGSFWLWLQQCSDILLAFIFTWIAVRRLGPAGFGLLTLAQAVLNLAGVATLNIELTIVRFVPEFRAQGHWREARVSIYQMLSVKALLAVLAAGILFLFASTIGSFYNNPELGLALKVGCLSLFSAALADIGASVCLGLLHPEIRVLMTTVRRAFEIVGLVVASFFGLSLVSAVAVLALADTLAALGYGLASTMYMLKDPKDSGESIQGKALFGKLLRYSFPLMGARLTEVVGREVGKLILGRLHLL